MKEFKQNSGTDHYDASLLMATMGLMGEVTTNAKDIPSPSAPCSPSPLELRELCGELMKTLEALIGEQNGPPMEVRRHKDAWQKAYDNANKITEKADSILNPKEKR